MFGSVRSAWTFLVVFTGPFALLVCVLRALEAAGNVSEYMQSADRWYWFLPIEKNSTKRSIEVLPQSSNGFLQNVHLRGALLSIRPLSG